MGEEGRDLRSAEEQEWSTTELRNSLRSIEWDLEVRLENLQLLIQTIKKSIMQKRIFEIQSNINSNWQDLDDTVQIVEKNPAKFRIDSSELLVRKSFIQQTRDEVNQMKERVSTGGTGGTNPTNRINIEVREVYPES